VSAAQALVSLGQLEAARGFLDKAKEINGNNYRLHTILAQIAEAEDRFQDAIQSTRLPSATYRKLSGGPLYPVQLR